MFHPSPSPYLIYILYKYDVYIKDLVIVGEPPSQNTKKGNKKKDTNINGARFDVCLKNLAFKVNRYIYVCRYKYKRIYISTKIKTIKR